MSRILNHQEFLKGCKVIFIGDDFTPHTGVVKDIYKHENKVTLKDVTFLDRVLDYEYEDINEGRERYFECKVDPHLIYRTNRFFLPKYPSIQAQMYVRILIDSILAIQDHVDIFSFIDKYHQRSLYTSTNTSVGPLLYQENYIEFNDNTAIIMNDSVSDVKNTGKKIYKMTKNEKYGWLFKEYSSKSDVNIDGLKPSKIIIPKWNNIKRGKGVKNKEDIDDVRDILKTKGLDINVIYDENFNEETIEYIYEFNKDVLFSNYFENNGFNIPYEQFAWIKTDDGIEIRKPILYDEMYERRNSL